MSQLKSNCTAGWKIYNHQLSLSTSPTVLGSSKCGKVSVGKWFDVDVCIKKMDDGVDLRLEIDALWRLRHPNLVSLYGICSSSVSTTLDMLITEYLPYNLHSLLQDVRLSPADILDYSVDILHGLEYLHSLSYIHGNINANNVLITSNNLAKITDFRVDTYKAYPVANHELSGTIAAVSDDKKVYYAPECFPPFNSVTKKIDVYAYGVLLVHMTAGITPTTSELENQLKLAATSCMFLAETMVLCLHASYVDRPTAAEARDRVKLLMQNDRYYPIERNSLPLKGISSATRKYIDDEIALKCDGIALSLEQTTNRLQAEQHRWQVEAGKVDMANTMLAEVTNKYTSLQSLYELCVRNCQKYQEDVGRMRSDADVQMVHDSELKGENYRLIERCSTLESTIAALHSDKDVLKSNNDLLHRRIEYMEKSIATLKSKEQSIESNRDEALEMYKLQQELCSELETRLEQALSRWQQESEKLKEERSRYFKLNTVCSLLTNRGDKQATDLQSLRSTLSSYDTLPPADEIRSIIDSLNREVQVKDTQYQELTQYTGRLEHDNKDLHDKGMHMAEGLERLESELSQAYARIDQFTKDCVTFRRDAITLRDSLTHELNTSMELQADKDTLQQTVKQLEKQVLEGEREVKILQRTLRKMQAQANGEAFDAMNDDAVVVSNENSSTSHNEDVNPVKKPVSIGAMLHNASKTQKVIAIQTQQNEEKELTKKADALRARDSNAKSIVTKMKANGVRGLLELFKSNCTSDDIIVWRCAREIRDEVIHNDSNKQECIVCRLDESIVDAVKHYPSSEMVQGQCLRLLGSLVYGNDHARRRFGELGMVQLIVDCMELYMDNLTILLHCCTAITNLTHHSIDNRQRYLEANGASILVTLMAKYIDNCKFQRQACWALLTIAGSDEASRDLANANAISAINNAMLQHQYDSGIQQFGCWAIANLALAGDDIRRKIKKAGFVEICRIVLETHRDDAETIRQAKHAIGVLGSSNQ